MTLRDSETTATSDREIIITRVFDAPRELVFDAWTDAEHVTHWWGPRGFSTTTHEMDLRPGGVWRFLMHGPDGTDYDNKVTFVEVVKPERLVYNHGPDHEGGAPPFEVTVTFQEEGRKTRLTLRLLFGSAEERDRAVEFGAVEGGNQTLERLADYLTRAQKE
jgi:uncharacterized protein YndB with AHSA1/START domain